MVDTSATQPSASRGGFGFPTIFLRFLVDPARTVRGLERLLEHTADPADSCDLG